MSKNSSFIPKNNKEQQRTSSIQSTKNDKAHKTYTTDRSHNAERCLGAMLASAILWVWLRKPAERMQLKDIVDVGVGQTVTVTINVRKVSQVDTMLTKTKEGKQQEDCIVGQLTG